MMDQMQNMENNLRRLVKNENYFSCFFQNRQPSNPFQKRLFQRKLRRSTVSCSDNYHKNDYVHQKQQKQHFCTQFEQQVQQTTKTIINQIQLLKEKLMEKQVQIMKDQRIPVLKKRMILKLMAQNFQKTSIFIIQNCLHIEQQILYPHIEEQVMQPHLKSQILYQRQTQRQQQKFQNERQNFGINYIYQQQNKQNRNYNQLVQNNSSMKNSKIQKNGRRASHQGKQMHDNINKAQECSIKLNCNSNKTNCNTTNNINNVNSNHHNSCENKYHLRPVQTKQHKSIYQAVLDERERKLRNIKKKLI